MNREDLQRLIDKDAVTASVSWGVFARDELPKGTLLPGAYVVNSHNAPGRHWFLLYVGDNIELYDSLGKSPRHYNLNMNCVYSKDKIQSNDTVTCGLFVLYFLYWRSRGIPMKMLTESLKKNGEEIIHHHLSYLNAL